MAEGLTLELFDRAAEGRLQATLDGELVLANGAAAAILGYEGGDALVDSVSHLTALVCNARDVDYILDRLQGSGALSNFQCQVYDAHRHPKWISLSAWGLRSFEGDLAGFEAMFTDVTARRLVETSARAVSSSLDPREALHAFAHALGAVLPFEHLTLTVVQGNSSRRIFSFGPHADEFRLDEVLPLEGHPTESVVRSGDPLVVEDTSEESWSMNAQLAGMGIGSYVVVPLLRDGKVFATLNLGFADRGTAGEAVADVLSSVAEAIAQGVENVLLFQDQRNALEQLRRLDEARRDFIGTVSHDLRSPMAAIAGFARILHEHWDSLGEKQKRRQVEHIFKSATHLEGFVNEVLQVAHLESGRFSYDLQPFDVRSLVDDAIEAMGELSVFVESRIADDLPPAYGDRHRCWQILTNLIGNSLKFSPAGESVEVDVSSAGSHLTIAVSDRGDGIPAERVEEVFNKFARIRKDSGTGAGLGLYISKKMVEAQGGRIWVEPRPGGGTTFLCTIPTVR